MVHLREANFERLCTTLFNQKGDTVPLIELGIDSSIKEKILQHPFKIYSIEDEIEFMRKMGYDFIKVQPVIALKINRRTTKKNIKSEFQITAPNRTWSAEHSGIITSWEDFETYPWPGWQDIDYTRFERARKLVPDNMGIIGQYGDIFTTAWEMMGFETFALAIYQDPDLVQAIIDKIAELILHMFVTMADMDWVGALWYSDDIAYTSGPMLNPDFFQTHFFPYLKQIGSLCRKRSIPFIYHSDGVLWEFMPDILASGVTALHPIEPKSMNIFEVKEKVGDRLCLCGGIEVDLLARGDQQKVIEMVSHYIEKLTTFGGYCVGSSNSIPEYVRVENYLAMIETTLTAGHGSR